MIQRERKQPKRRGAAAVELAALLPVLMFMLLAAIDYSRVFYDSLTLASAARNGSLWESDEVFASESPYTSAEEAALADASNLTPEPVVLTSSSSSGDTAIIVPTGSNSIGVKVSTTFDTLTDFPGIPKTATPNHTLYMRKAPVLPDF